MHDGPLSKGPSVSPCPFWAKPVNPRRLVDAHDGSDASSYSCPCPAALDGIPGRVPGYRRLGPLQGLMVSRYPGVYASPLHQRGGILTRTGMKLSPWRARCRWSPAIAVYSERIAPKAAPWKSA